MAAGCAWLPVFASSRAPTSSSCTRASPSQLGERGNGRGSLSFAGQIEQALINLLKNAHEAGGAAEEVSVGIGAQGAEWRIEVRDRGPGMSEAQLAQALLPFYSTKRSGSGLGLALAREIAEAHGGRIGLANREHGGLCVSLSLPRG